MKCEHCGKNEVTFVYRSNINGNVEEKRLCTQCAEQLGYTRHLVAQNRSLNSMMRNFWNDSFFGGNLLGNFFSPSLSGRMIENPFDDFFSDMPALGAAPAKPAEQKGQLADQETCGHFDRQRRLNALRMEMKQAVSREDFERAAQIRDELRSLEAQEQNSSCTEEQKS